MSSLILVAAASTMVWDVATMWMYRGVSPGWSLVRSGIHTPFVVMDAPVSSAIYLFVRIVTQKMTTRAAFSPAFVSPLW